MSSIYSIAPPRQIGFCNWIGITALIQKEVGRFLNVYMQTLVAPVMTLMLFFVVFHLSNGQQSIAGDAHMIFLGSGLLMMAMVQNAFSNPASSLIIAKVQGNIVDILMPPLSPWELLTGMMVGAILRSVLIGVLGFAALNLVVPLHMVAPWTVFSFMILGNVMLAALGVMAGLWAEKFDHMASVTNFIVTPLTFLSGTFYALSALPPFWQKLALLNPFFYMIDGFRSGFTGFAETDKWIGLSYVGALDVALVLGAWYMLRTGYKTKF